MAGRIVNRVWRFALSRRWWAGHVLVAAGCGLFLGLARWQWGRFGSIAGDWQNLGYALQWPLFAGFLVVAWLRFLWLERDSATVRPAPAAASAAGRAVLPPTPPPTPEDDDELAAYNAYLARLADKDRRR
jgi:DNA-binding transcriptional regulator of glucitol operon